MAVEQDIEQLELIVGGRSDKEKQVLMTFAAGKSDDPMSVLFKYCKLAASKAIQDEQAKNVPETPKTVKATTTKKAKEE